MASLSCSDLHSLIMEWGSHFHFYPVTTVSDGGRQQLKPEGRTGSFLLTPPATSPCEASGKSDSTLVVRETNPQAMKPQKHPEYVITLAFPLWLLALQAWAGVSVGHMAVSVWMLPLPWGGFIESTEAEGDHGSTAGSSMAHEDLPARLNVVRTSLDQ